MIKVAIIGPESTGKTWLASELAIHYKSPMVKEYSREYFHKREYSYNMDDLTKIAKGQISNKINFSEESDFLICDTELITIAIWSHVVFNRVSEFLISEIPKQNYDIYLLCNLDVSWKKDRFRKNGHNRQYIYEMFVNELTKYNFNYQVIEGIGQQRLENAINAIEALVNEGIE